jgi:hypothetical protein
MKTWRKLYLLASGLFLAGVVAQVFLAGMVVVSGRMGWALHKDLGHSLGLPLLAMLLGVYLGRMPARMKRLTWLLFGTYLLQADVLLLLRASAPLAAAFHPVLALLDFALGAYLAAEAWTLARAPLPASSLRPAGEPTPAK